MIRIAPRLRTAIEMAPPCRTVADIACDHGKLGAAVLLENRAEFLIDTDISAASLCKARMLTEQLSLSERTEFRIGDGLKPIAAGEVQTVFLMGIGGTLMREILSAAEIPFAGARLAVLQPMKSPEDIRLYLFQNKYHIRDDRMIQEGGRYYQVFSAEPPDGRKEQLPSWWPSECWSVGYHAAERKDPVMKRYLDERIRMLDAIILNGAPVKRERDGLRTILEKMGEKDYEA